MKERTSASDEKYHNNFEILPYIVVNIRQVIKGCIFPLTHRHLFTSLLNNFAPKMYAFSPIEMECRVKLAALYYNENAGWQQHTTSDGKLAYQIKYPKYKKGGYIVQKILQDKTYDYVMTLWDQVLNECQQTCHGRRSAAMAVDLPLTLCADLVHPQKEDAIREHQTRYQCKQ